MLFYIFSTFLIAFALGVIFVRATIVSVLFLIVCFINASALFILLSADYVGITLAVVYIGAVAILFLFVVMLLDQDAQVKREQLAHYFPLGMLMGGVLLFEIIGSFAAYQFEVPLTTATERFFTIKDFGAVLYTDYVVLFQIAGLILLEAMVGAVVLTQGKGLMVKKQDPSEQALQPSSIILKTIKPNSAVAIVAKDEQ